jgi:hypothetical protein
MIYNDIPVYVGLANDSGDSVSNGLDYFLYASRCGVRSSMPTRTSKRLCKPSDFNHDYVPKETAPVGNLDVTIDMDFYLLNSDFEGGYGFLFDNWDDGGTQRGNGTGKNFFPIRFDGNLYKKCYIQNYKVSVGAFAPVTVSASFKCFDPPVSLEYLENSDGSDWNAYLDSNRFVYGYTSSISRSTAAGFTDVGVKKAYDDFASAVNYQKDFAIRPVYDIKSCELNRVVIDSVEHSMLIESTGFSTFISKSGDRLNGSVDIILRDSLGSGITTEDLSFSMGGDALITEQAHGVQGGDSLITRTEIKGTIF